MKTNEEYRLLEQKCDTLLAALKGISQKLFSATECHQNAVAFLVSEAREIADDVIESVKDGAA